MTSAPNGADFDIFVETEAGDWQATLPEAEALVRRAVAAALAGARAAAAAGGPHPVPDGPGEMSVLLSDDATVRQLNHQYRGKDKATNVLSFPMMEEEEEGDDVFEDDGEGDQGDGDGDDADLPPLLLGDIILAYETLVKESTEQGKPLADHLTHLVIHGVLHLLGYDHIEDADADRMERLETTILAGLGIADPYRDGGGMMD